MAPELFQNGPQSTASDLWALGCVMYECAAGKPPFAAGSLTQLVHDIMTADPVPIAGAHTDELGQHCRQQSLYQHQCWIF